MTVPVNVGGRVKPGSDAHHGGGFPAQLAQPDGDLGRRGLQGAQDRPGRTGRRELVVDVNGTTVQIGSDPLAVGWLELRVLASLQQGLAVQRGGRRRYRDRGDFPGSGRGGEVPLQAPPF